MDTPEQFPEGWTQITNETFANLDAWTTYEPDTGVVYQDTIWLGSQMGVREGGGMRLTATDELIDGKYPGALAYSKAFYSYGFFECYCKVPFGYLWPVFFLYDSQRYFEGADKNEIDIFEWIGTGVVYVTTHIVTQQEQQIIASGDISTTYHKWGCYWDATTIRIYRDDHLFAQITDPSHIPQVPMNIMFQHSIDGWAQAPTNVTFPALFDVDWVKVWVKDNTYR